MSMPNTDTVYYVTSCTYLPPKVNSDTPWFNIKGYLPERALPIMQLQLCLIFFLTFFFHTFLGRLGVPRFTSMSIVGLIFGSAFNEKWAERCQMLFFYDSQANLGLLSVLGYMLFLFYTGVKTDMSLVHRSKRIATNTGSIAILVPFLFGMAVLHFYSAKYLDIDQARKLGVIAGLLSMSPFTNICVLLSDLKILNSELGRLGQSSALVTEFFNVFLTTILNFTKLMYQDSSKAWISLLAGILFVLLVIFIIRPAMFWIIKQTPEGSPVSDNYVYCILIMALLASYASHNFGFYALFGPFMLGLVTPEGPPLGTAITNKIDTFVNGILMPVFVTTCAMRVNLKDLLNWRDKMDGTIDHFMVQTLVIVVVTTVVKFVVCTLPPLYINMPFRDAVSLSVIMNCKGTVEMGGFSLLRDVMGMPDNVFALVMLCIIVNATVMPMFLYYLYDPMKKYAANYTKRNIVDLRRNSELRVLTIIHRPDNIPPTINILEATYPTKDEPLCAYVFQLIELIGRASPVFVCHQLQKNSDNTSMAYKLIDAFHNFEQEFKHALVVNTFTAITPSELMYDDICTLALSKFTSLIVLPFHKKWSSDGNCIEIEDEALRELNFRVMERAPCSVGILIERAQMTHVFSPETPYMVCVLFIGGKDDREALFFAKRMTKNPYVRLTVVRFVAEESAMANFSKGRDWQGLLLDTEILNDLKVKKVGEGSVKYDEKRVKDGPETALVIRELASEYDLIVVGRQAGVETPQTSGLLKWSEYPELGVIGDLLASTDAAGKASVFVIQQQRTAKDP